MPPHMFISDDWKEWIAMNAMLDQPGDGLVKILVEQGFPPELSRLEVQSAMTHPYVAAARSLVRQRSKRDWLLHTRRLLEQTSGRPSAERRKSIDREEFFAEYYSQNRPVIITDVVRRWPAMQRWTHEYLAERVGDREVEIQANRNSDPRYEIDSLRHRKRLRFSDYLKMVFTDGETNDYYMTANNAEVNQAALAPLHDDIDGLPEYLDPSERGRMFFWLGPAGTVTPVHHDLTNNFMAQVVGRKRIQLISPSHLPLLYNDFHCYSAVDLDNIDTDRYPQFRDVRIEEVILEPGELLFLPVGWWHHVVGLDVTITITCTNFLANNDFTPYYHTYSAI